MSTFDPGLALALVLAASIGFSLGLLGSGGSIITLPVLVYLARVPVNQAVGMSLAVVGGTSLAGSLLQYRQGTLEPRAAIPFTLAGAVGAFAGARLTHALPPRVLLFLFGLLMLAAGLSLLRRRVPEAAPFASGGRPCRPWHCAGAGLGVGVLTGFLGVGGGFLVVPALVLFGGLDTRRAIGTSLAVIAANALFGLLGQLRHVTFPAGLTLAFTASAIVGMRFGVLAGGRLPERALRRVLAVFILVVAIILLVRNGVA